MTYEEAITSYGREFTSTLTFYGSDTVTVTGASWTVEQSFGENDTALSMGYAISNSFKASFYNENPSHDYRNNKVRVQITIDLQDGTTETKELGAYRVSSVSTSADFHTVNIEAYDRMAELRNEKYVPSAGLEDAYDVLSDIATQYSLQFYISNTEIAAWRSYPVDTFYDCTVAQMLAWMAGLRGYNVWLPFGGLNYSQGMLKYGWYSSTECEVTPEMQFMDGFIQKAEQEFVIMSVTSGYGDNTITAGSGKGIIFTNPYITAANVQVIYNRWLGFSYLPCEVTWFGDPTVKCGDIIVVQDREGNAKTVMVSQQTLTFDGGFSSKIVSAGTDATDIAFDNISPTDLKIENLRIEYTNMQAAQAEAMQALVGRNGGVFEIVDDNNDGINDGWIIRNETVSPPQYIKANSAGIGFWDGDINTPPSVAILTNGQIVADYITTGTMSAERIAVNGYGLNNYFHVEEVGGVVTVRIGDPINGLVLTQTGSRIAFTDTQGNPVTYWDAATGEFSLPLLNKFQLGGGAITEQGTGNWVFDLA